MLRIFISHSWNEHTLYERFVESLEEVLGRTRWENLSIPRNAAIDVLSDQSLRQENEYRRLEEELWLLRAKLRDPNLPDVLSRTVWLDGQPIEVPTVGSVRAEIEQVETLMQKFAIEVCHGRGDTVDPKNASAHIRAYPELSIAIRDRLQNADIVFVLLTPLVRLHQWVDYEIAIGAMVRVRIVGVRTVSFYASRDIHIDCDEVIDMDDENLRRVLNPFL